MIRVAVIGASGFTGEKLVELLLDHPEVKVSYLSAKLDRELKFSEMFARFKNKLDLTCKNLDLEEAQRSSEIIFLALPHTVSFKIAPFFLKRKKIVIDLSADYRLGNVQTYKKFYGAAHQDKNNLKRAVYGLPEFYKDKIRKAALIANPGCYPTVSILSMAPLLKEGIIRDVIIDAKSGVTGAGRRASLEYHYAHLTGNLFSYKPFEHQHLPEINQILSDIAKKKASLRFTPHLIPVQRGIFVTGYARMLKSIKKEKIYKVYEKFYRKQPFIRLFRGLPQLKDVIDTNFCDIGFEVKERDILVVGVIDNLIKGASGQAIQNMNIRLGFNEETGLL